MKVAMNQTKSAIEVWSDIQNEHGFAAATRILTNYLESPLLPEDNILAEVRFRYELASAAGRGRSYVKNLWAEFGDVPMDPETECLDDWWLIFPPGTHREDVWYWFEDFFNVSVAEDLMYN